jgi:hypothetical protein
LSYWFQQLDKASASIGQTVEGIPLPMEFCAALSFLALEPESPFFKQTEIPPGLDLDVAEVLQRARTAALQLIELVGEVGGPLSLGPSSFFELLLPTSGNLGVRKPHQAMILLHSQPVRACLCREEAH